MLVSIPQSFPGETWNWLPEAEEEERQRKEAATPVQQVVCLRSWELTEEACLKRPETDLCVLVPDLI